MASGPSIIATLGLDSKPLQQGLASAKGAVAGFAGKLTSALGVGLGVGAIASFGKSLVDMAGDLRDAADNLDIGVESLQKLQGAFSMGGVNAEALNAALAKFSQTIAEAREGSDTARESLARFGITAQDLQSLGVDELLNKVSRAAAGYADKQRLVNDLVSVFGKQGKRMAGVLSDANFEETKKGMLALSDEQSRILDEAGDTWARYWKNVKTASAAGLAEVFAMMTGKKSELRDMMLGIQNPKSQSAEAKKQGGEFVGPSKEEVRKQEAIQETERIELEKTAEAQTRIDKVNRDSAFSRLTSLQKIEDIRLRILRLNQQAAAIDKEGGGKEAAEKRAQAAELNEQARQLFIQEQLAGPGARIQARRDARKARQASAKFDRMMERKAAEDLRRAKAGQAPEPIVGKGGKADPIAVALEKEAAKTEQRWAKLEKILSGKFTNE